MNLNLEVNHMQCWGRQELVILGILGSQIQKRYLTTILLARKEKYQDRRKLPSNTRIFKTYLQKNYQFRFNFGFLILQLWF